MNIRQEDLLKQAARERILDDALIMGSLIRSPEPQTEATPREWPNLLSPEQIRAKMAEEMAECIDRDFMAESEPEKPETLDFEPIRTENGQVWHWEHQNDSETA